jgi:hypothetical protein
VVASLWQHAQHTRHVALLQEFCKHHSWRRLVSALAGLHGVQMPYIVLTPVTPLLLQAQSRQDVFTVSEQLVDELKILADIAARENSNLAKAGSTASKRSSTGGGRQAAPLPAPPQACIAALHPFFFAAGLPGSSSSRHSSSSSARPEATAAAAAAAVAAAVDTGQAAAEASDAAGPCSRLQLGVYVQLCAWLLRIIGRLELAQRLESELDASSSSSSSASSSTSRRGQEATAGKAGLAKSSSSNSSSAARRRTTSAGRQQQRAAPQQAELPKCKDCMKSAGQVLKVLSILGICTDFVTTSALAAGCGRVACGALQVSCCCCCCGHRMRIWP